MHRIRLIGLVPTLLAFILLGAQVSLAKGAPSAKHANRLLVKMRSDVPVGQMMLTHAARGVRFVESLPASGIEVMEVSDPTLALEEACGELEESGLVEYAEPDYIVYPTVLPNDPDFGSLWGLDQANDIDIDAPEAWDTTEGDASIVVAVIDTGVDYDHPDLAANMWRNPGEVANGLDDDGNGYVDDIHGIDCIAGDGDPNDWDGHGTHVSGTIAAVGNNGRAVVGVAPKVKIMALRFIGDFGGSTSDAIECLNYARDMKNRGVDVRVANNSWGGPGFSTSMRDTIQMMSDAGILFVAASGNEGSNTDGIGHYPSAYDVANLVSVAAIDEDGQLAGFSNFGVQTVDLAAPGVDILSLTWGGRVDTFSGTSMATPHVSGVAALIASHLPGASVDRMRSLLVDTATPLPSLVGLVASEATLNAADALCSPGDYTIRLSPRDDVRLGWYHDTPVRVTVRDCGVPVLGASVNVAFSSGEPTLSARDDGIAPDEAGGDGVYTAPWQPKTLGEVEIGVAAATGGPTLQASSRVVVVDVPEYTVSDQVAFQWTTGSFERDTKLTKDDAGKSVKVGFDFPFYGSTYDRVQVSTNGYITFGKDGKQYQNLPLPNTEGPGPLIAPYWDDLDPSEGGSITYRTEGEAPDRSFTVRWSGIEYYRVNDPVSFEATLFERDGRITFRYLDVTGGPSYKNGGASATIGIQNEEGDFALLYSFALASVADGSALEFRVDDAKRPDELALVAGRKLLVKDRLAQPEKRRFAFSTRDAGIRAPELGGSSDPSRWGAWLTLRNPLTGEETDQWLAPEGWRASGNGYRYRGKTGACRAVSVKNGRAGAICRGSDLALTLDEASQGELAVRLDLGAKHSLCAHFGGEISRDEGTGSSSQGLFAARAAPAPLSCPIP